MSKNDSNTNDDWRDRLIDRALQETVGGDAPPDLSQRILAVARTAAPETSQVGDLTVSTKTAATETAPKSWSVRGWVLAASLLINVTLAGLLFSDFRSERTEVAVRDTLATVADSSKSLEGTPTEQAEGGATADFDSLIDTVTSTVEADAWSESKSGDRPFPDNLRLEIKQSQEVHEGAAAMPEYTGDLNVPHRAESFISEAHGEQGGGEQAAEGQPSSLPSPYYRSDDVQYHAPGPEFGQAKEAERLEIESRSRRRKSKDVVTAEDVDVSGDGLARGEALQESDEEVTTRLGTKILPRLSVRGETVAERERYDYEPLYAKLDKAREDGWRWGFQGGGRGEPWPGGQAGEQWHGSPDGEGIGPGAGGDKYERIYENPFVPAIGGEAISTFSIDVDTASYSNVRQMLLSGHMPPAAAVRLEELVNYFSYDYEGPSSDSEQPFAAHVETAGCPWRPQHRLVRIAIKGRELAPEKRPQSNLVFLVDVSGSMNNPDKLPLVKQGLIKLAEQLGENDRVAIVVYASSEGLVLDSTPGTEQETILDALDNLNAGGSTAGGAGIRLAYQVAEDNFIEGGTNRVILCTDGDFNVGTTSTAELERLVEEKAKDTRVFLSAIGFGRGNLNDAMMEKITGIGNGNYYYVDGERESERVFVQGMTGMLVTIAKDVKIQVEFNPAEVAGYRLLGYENRMLETQDFNDDKKDAGDIGAGHTVTCLYEIVPAGEEVEAAEIDELKYQRPAGLTDAAETDELLTLKMRYKQPDEDTSTKLQWPVTDSGNEFSQASTDMQFATAVASFGMLLRDSQYKGDATYDAVLEIAASAKGDDPEGERAEFLDVVRAAKGLSGEVEAAEEEEE